MGRGGGVVREREGKEVKGNEIEVRREFKRRDW